MGEMKKNAMNFRYKILPPITFIGWKGGYKYCYVYKDRKLVDYPHSAPISISVVSIERSKEWGVHKH